MNKLALLALAAIPGLASASTHYVYTLLNQASGNVVRTYTQGPNGILQFAADAYTGGRGTSSGLGSQGSLRLTEGGRYLITVNAGNNSLSLFSLLNGLPVLSDVEYSGGDGPISVTESDGLVYVMNAGTATSPGNVRGFAMFLGELIPIPGAIAPLSAGGVSPEEVRFTPDGSGLVVSEKVSGLIDTFALDSRGLPVDYAYQPSAGAGPYGFDFDKSGRMYITEATASDVSSYSFGPDLSLTPISKSVPTEQAAACWDVVSPNGRFLYTGNAGSGTVSGFAIASNGTVALLNSKGISGTTGGKTLDEAMSADGAFLYVLSSVNQRITAFQVAANGGLTPVSTANGLPTGTTGLVAR